MATTQLGRRAFLQAAVATTGGVLVSGSLETILGGAAGATPAPLPLGPVADLRDGKVRLHLPRGFRYRSFHDTDVLTGSPPITLDDGTLLPGRHDGMAAFRGRHGTVWLVRNHEVNGPVAAPFGPGEPYDHHTGGGTTTIRVTPDGHVLEAFTSLNGTQMNCSGGAMPWGSWITCEETVNGPDVGADFTNAPNVTLEQRHGFLFEVPAGGQSDREPITSAGRFAHEAAAYSPHEGYVYLTEDNFAFPSGLYRYRPPVNPMRARRLVNGGRLQMLRVKGQPEAHLEAEQVIGASYKVEWVDIDDPDPTFPYTPGLPAPTTNNEAIVYVGDAGPRAGRRPLLPPGGRDLHEGRGVLHLHAGRRTGGDRPAADPRVRARRGPGVVVRPAPPTAHVPLPVAGHGNARAAGQHHGAQQPRDDRAVRGRPRRQLHPRPQPSVDLVRHRPEPADPQQRVA